MEESWLAHIVFHFCICITVARSAKCSGPLDNCNIAINSWGRGVWTLTKEGTLVIAEMSKDTGCPYELVSLTLVSLMQVGIWHMREGVIVLSWKPATLIVTSGNSFDTGKELSAWQCCRTIILCWELFSCRLWTWRLCQEYCCHSVGGAGTVLKWNLKPRQSERRPRGEQAGLSVTLGSWQFCLSEQDLHAGQRPLVLTIGCQHHTVPEEIVVLSTTRAFLVCRGSRLIFLDDSRKNMHNTYHHNAQKIYHAHVPLDPGSFPSCAVIIVFPLSMEKSFLFFNYFWFGVFCLIWLKTVCRASVRNFFSLSPAAEWWQSAEGRMDLHLK